MSELFPTVLLHQWSAVPLELLWKSTDFLLHYRVKHSLSFRENALQGSEKCVMFVRNYCGMFDIAANNNWQYESPIETHKIPLISEYCACAGSRRETRSRLKSRSIGNELLLGELWRIENGCSALNSKFNCRRTHLWTIAVQIQTIW
jgi:hypothetical protein